MGFDESILMKRKKEIQEKLRRRNQKQSKNSKVQCLGYIPSHTFLLVHEDGNGQFRFELTPDVVKQINDAREMYQDYERNGRSSHFFASSYGNSSSNPEIARPQKKKSIDIFNDELKKAINEKGKDDFLRFYSAKDAPDGKKIPTLKAIALKCEKREYKNVKDFINNKAEIKSFYKDKDPATAKKADEMYLVFKNITEDLKKKRKATSHSKKDSSKKPSEK